MTSSASSHNRRMTYQRLKRLTTKEMREILRDRRTIITLVLMPLLVYPLLSLVFHRFLLTSLPSTTDTELIIAVNKPNSKALQELLDRGSSFLRQRQAAAESETAAPEAQTPSTPPSAKSPANESPRVFLREIENVAAQVRDLRVDLGVVMTRPPDDESVRPQLRLLYRAESVNSRKALRFVEERLHALNEGYYKIIMLQFRSNPIPPAPFERRVVKADQSPGMSLATVAPLILILMTITGAVYPAIDLTAGERERGTLETLIAAPVPRLGLLFAKYVAVLTVALMTATINMTAMTATILISGLGEQIFGAGVFSPITLLQVFGLLALFAAFFSAVLLTLTSMARSFKEAQAYLVPLMLVSLAPGILGAMPGLELNGVLAITPLVNIVLLSRDLLNGDVNMTLAVVAICATLFYTAEAIALAANIFGGDAVLYGAQGSWRDLCRRPEGKQDYAKLSTATLCLTLIFPLFYLISGLLPRLSGVGMGVKVLLAGMATPLLFGLIPFALAGWNRIRWRSGFAMTLPRWWAFLPAIGLGLAMWPFAHELVLFAEMLGVGAITSEQFEGIEKMLAAWQSLPPWAILLAFAAGPAIFEELFFRGLLFGALARNLSPWKTIAISAALFGAFHVVAGSVLAVERLLPSAFIGLFLGWLRYRSGSVWPTILAHLAHNGLLLSVAYYRDDLMANGWGIDDQSHLPWTWLLTAGLLVAASLALTIPLKPRSQGRHIPEKPGGQSNPAKPSKEPELSDSAIDDASGTA